jgi:two-component system OmpR family sensor kinase
VSGSRLSLRARLTLTSAASLLAALAVFALVVVLLVTRELRSSLEEALSSRARAVAQLAVSAPALLDQAGALEAPASGRELAVEVLDAHGRVLARSLTLGASVLPEGRLVRAVIARGVSGFADVRVDGRALRMYAAPVADLGGPAAGGAVLVASPTGENDRTIAHLGLAVALGGLAVLAGAALLAALVTGRALAPLRRLASAAEEIERTGDSARRLPEDGGATELATLAGVLNRMLASLERSRAAEARLLADASHELRTPVAALLGNVEYALRHGAEPEVLSDMERDARRLARLVDDLLVLERTRAAPAEPRLLALDELVRGVIGEHPEAARVEISALEPARVLGDEAALARALGNLLENAAVHGPPGAPIEVALRLAGGFARVSVCDRGPGPDPAELALLFERFRRGADAGGRPGSGLGLAIVQAVAEQHGGRVEVEGARFTLLLGLAS